VSAAGGDEGPHAPGAELGWREAYWFTLHDAGSGLAGIVRFDVRPNQGTRDAALSFFVLQDGGFITARHVAPHALGDARLEVEGTSLAMVEPERRWRLDHDGPGHSLAAASDADQPEAWRRSRLERLTVALDVETTTPPVDSDGGFAQPARFTGEVWLSGDRYEIDALGLRGKDWGVPPSSRVAVRVALAFDDGRAMLVERSVLDDGTERSAGWILEGDAVAPVAAVTLAADEGGRDERLPRSLRVVLRTQDGRSHGCDVQALLVAPLPGARGGRDNLLCLAPATASWSGATGRGVIEVLHRLDATGRPLEPVLRDARRDQKL